MQKKTLFLGSVMADVVCPIDFFPQPGQGVVSQGVVQAIGGCAFNAANIARQMGAQCDLFAPVGTGMYAMFLEQELSTRGYKVFKVDSNMDCGAAICLVESNGERTMITLPGVERYFEASWFEQLDASEYSATYICGYELGGSGGLAVLDFLEAHPDMQVYFAPGPTICALPQERLDRINRLHPVWHLNDAEALSYTGCATIEQAGLSLASDCANLVLITEGPVGCHVFEGQAHTLVPSTPVKPVDTIGAGDSNIGTFIAARQLGYGVKEAVEVANMVSAKVCQIQGATFRDQDLEKMHLFALA